MEGKTERERKRDRVREREKERDSLNESMQRGVRIITFISQGQGSDLV